ncbi:MAG: hypothetical protein M3Z05_14015 [Gemmatimonadota bacterium]|nr:hypothetical protein [Gemmatimonadota bacterium]
MIRTSVAAAGAALLVIQIACGRDSSDRLADTIVPDAKGKSFPAADPVLSAVPARDSVSLFPVTWTVDFLLERLASAGLPPTLAGPVQVKHMAVPGTRVLIPGAELEVYLYGDANATAPDIDRFYKLMRMPDGALMWKKPPALVTANNMVIVVLTGDTAVRERVRDVLHLSHIHSTPRAAP